jgi:digeranylgeranylglycerophospholipid reductase
MKYDVIIAGAGPAGLMAAKTAAEDGLKVLLLERKKEITEINRLCGQWTSLNFSVAGEPLKKYGYLEPISLEVGTDATRVHFPTLGFAVNYKGPLRPYMRWIHFSPSGFRVHREKEGTIFGFFWEKESLLRGLLSETKKAGAEVWTEAAVTAAENTKDGVAVKVRTKSGDLTVEARKALAADGTASKMVETLGLNEKRRMMGSPDSGGGVVGYVLEGIETEFRLNAWLQFTIPELSRPNIWMFMVAGDRNVLGTVGGTTQIVDRFMKLPYFEPWFRNAKIVKKMGTSMGTIRSPLLEPVAGNVLAIGDSAAFLEVTNPGAIACGYQGAKAALKELSGKKGYTEYVRWWQRSFETNLPEYPKIAARFYAINGICTNEEIDYLYRLVADKLGLPGMLIARSMGRIKTERPELFAKLSKAGISEDIAEMKIGLFEAMGMEK